VKRPLIILTLCAIFILISAPIYGNGLGDLDLIKTRTISITATDTGNAVTLGGTAILPIGQLNGGLAVSYLRTEIEETLSDAFQYRLQAGPRWKTASLQFYIEGHARKYNDAGSFIRPGTYTYNGWTLSGGIGTYLRGLADTLRRDKDDPETLIKPLAFVSINKPIGTGNLNTLITWSPTFDFELHDLLIEPKFTTRIGKIGLTVVGRFGQKQDMTERAYIAQLDIPF